MSITVTASVTATATVSVGSPSMADRPITISV